MLSSLYENKPHHSLLLARISRDMHSDGRWSNPVQPCLLELIVYMAFYRLLNMLRITRMCMSMCTRTSRCPSIACNCLILSILTYFHLGISCICVCCIDHRSRWGLGLFDIFEPGKLPPNGLCTTINCGRLQYRILMPGQLSLAFVGIMQPCIIFVHLQAYHCGY